MGRIRSVLRPPPTSSLRCGGAQVIVVAVGLAEHRLVTERLVLRRWQASDAPAYASLCSDPEVMRWIGDGRPLAVDDSRGALERFEEAWARNGFGLFALEERDTGECIGFAGLSIPTFLPELLPAVEIGWRLARRAWGKGLATEAAKAALAFGFGRPELERIVSIYQSANVASSRIMEKIGMRFERETVHPTHGRPLRVYEITREDWRRNLASPA